MTEYIVVVEGVLDFTQPPKCVGSESNEVVFTVPPAGRPPINTVYREEQNSIVRKEHPEEWMVKNILPKFPNRTIRLYQLRAAYEPATHKRSE